MIAIQFLKAFAIGVCAAAPIGPVALLVMQKTLTRGLREGWMVGWGSTTVDAFWGAVTLLAFSVFADMLNKYLDTLQIVGGIILIFIGLSILLKDISTFRNGPMRQKASSSPKYYFQGLLTALSNPAALFFMVAIAAFWNLDTEVAFPVVLVYIALIFAGGVSYWFFFTRLTGKLRDRLSMKLLTWLNRLAGIAVLIFSTFLIVRGINGIIA